MDNGWDESAAAWIDDMGERGDFSREFILDPALRARIGLGTFADALDVGCGEGRFCRILRELGIAATGIDPTAALLERARELDPEGRYVEARAEALPFADASFDLVVSYVTLVDIEDADAAIAEMARVLRPGGTLLVANLNSFATANGGASWVKCRGDGDPCLKIDNYQQIRADWVSWRGITIRNWHRPMSAYMAAFLGAGLMLSHFDEPVPVGGDPQRAAWFTRIPYFIVMEWEKPG